MDIYELIKKRRTVRKFTRKKIDRALIEKFIETARFAPSAMNAQPVRYMIVQGETADRVFPSTHWAGNLKGLHSPSFDERPDSYILFLVPKGKKPEHDVGAIAQSIGLMAFSEGIGTCWMGAIDRDEISDICFVPNDYEIETLLALGYPAEKPVAIDSLKGETKYFLDEESVLTVPKLTKDDLIV